MDLWIPNLLPQLITEQWLRAKDGQRGSSLPLQATQEDLDPLQVVQKTGDWLH